MLTVGKHMYFLASFRSTGLLISFLVCRSAYCNRSPCAAQGILQSHSTVKNVPPVKSSHQLNSLRCFLTGFAEVRKGLHQCCWVRTFLRFGLKFFWFWRCYPNVLESHICTSSSSSRLPPPLTVCKKQLVVLAESDGL